MTGAGRRGGTRTAAVAAAAVAVGAAALSSASAFTALSSLATTASIFGKSGGTDGVCPRTITISSTASTFPRNDSSLVAPVGGLSINGAACTGGGNLIGGPASVFAIETDPTTTLGQVKAAYESSGARLVDPYFSRAADGDFDVFFFPRNAATQCGGWRVAAGTVFTVFRVKDDYLWGALGSVRAGAVQIVYSPEEALNCFFVDAAKTQAAPSLGEGVPIPIDFLSNVALPTPTSEAEAAATVTPIVTPTDPTTTGPTTTGPTTTDPTTTDPTTAEPTATPSDASATPVATPVSASTIASEDEDSACFPASAKVQLADGSAVPLHALAVGASVRVAAGAHDGAHSTVIGWSHRDGAVEAEFVALTHTAGKLLLSPGHYVYVDGVAVTARSVRLGDALALGDGDVAFVTVVGREAGTGLYNAHTAHGDVVVDGVVVSTYTDAVHPVVAHALLAPVRLAVRLGVVDPLGSFLHGPRPWLAALAPRGK